VPTLALVACVSAQMAATTRDEFISVQAPQVALEHVDVIDGSGSAIRRDQTVILTNDRITATANVDPRHHDHRRRGPRRRAVRPPSGAAETPPTRTDPKVRCEGCLAIHFDHVGTA